MSSSKNLYVERLVFWIVIYIHKYEYIHLIWVKKTCGSLLDKAGRTAPHIASGTADDGEGRSRTSMCFAAPARPCAMAANIPERKT
jgi:hypothetical protein